MSPVVALGFGAFAVVSLTVGLRLLLLWRRTRELPELLIGIGVLGIGPVGFGFMTAAGLVIEAQPALGRALFGTSALAVAGGSFAKYVFNWRVYHRSSRTIGALVWGAGLALATCFVLQISGENLTRPEHLGPVEIARQILLIGCLLWGSGESLAYWRKMRQRLRLGLSDPITTDRFLMWGVGAGAAGLGSAAGFVGQLLTGVPMIHSPGLMMSSSMHGLLAAVALWLAFVPPRAYQRFVARRAAA